MSELSIGLRRLLARPFRTLLIIFIIAIGIGAATAVFSVVDQTVLRAAPFLYADRLVDVFDTNRTTGGGGNSLSPAKIVGWWSQPALFERFEAIEPAMFDIAGDGVPERVQAGRVSLGLFPMLGVSPAIGRGFVDGDGRPGTDHVAVIGDALWRRRFGARPDVLGRVITLNDQEYTVIGVMPRRFRLSGEQQLWVPIDLRAHASETKGFAFYGIGRLTRGVRIADAQSLADRLADRLQRAAPLARSWDLDVKPKRVAMIDQTTRTAMLVLLGAVGLVLLITCANVASILLTDMPARLREMALRSALGASRARLARSMLLESAALVSAGGAIGLLIAWWAVAAIVAAVPPGLLWQMTTTVEIDGRVLAVACGLIAIATLAVGAIPALRGSHPGTDWLLRGAGGRASLGRLPGALIVAEVALSLMLLAGAVLLTRTLVNLEAIDPGFDPHGLLAMNVTLTSDRFPSASARAAFLEEVQRRIARVPGVSGSTVTLGLPPALGGFSWGELQVEGRGTVQQEISVVDATVGPEYFAVTRTPIVAGRVFGDHEPSDSAIVSRGFADRLAPDGRAIGLRFRIGTDGVWNTVVGISGNVESRIGLDSRTSLQWYAPWGVASSTAPAPRPVRRTYYVRTVVIRSADPGATIPAVKQAVWDVDSRQPIESVSLATDLYAQAFGRQRFVLQLMTAFAAVALFLTAAGLFGLLARMFPQRTREIGIRVALGAAPAQVLRLVVAHAAMLTAIGTGIGIGGALALAPVLRSLLFEVTPTDPFSYAIVAALLLAVALAASWIPARSAMQVDPAVALRTE
jgi:putative ABC transport system permease protein